MLEGDKCYKQEGREGGRERERKRVRERKERERTE
jgi:hypothetical protein